MTGKRILARTTARELTLDETEIVGGGWINTKWTNPRTATNTPNMCDIDSGTDVEDDNPNNSI